MPKKEEQTLVIGCEKYSIFLLRKKIKYIFAAKSKRSRKDKFLYFSFEKSKSVEEGAIYLYSNC